MLRPRRERRAGRRPTSWRWAPRRGLAHPLGGAARRGALPVRGAASQSARAPLTLSAVAPGTSRGTRTLAVPLGAAPAAPPGHRRQRQQLIVGDAAAGRRSSISARDRFGNPTSAADVFVRGRRARPRRSAVTASGVAMISVVAAGQLRRARERRRRRDARRRRGDREPAHHGRPAGAPHAAGGGGARGRATASAGRSCAFRRVDSNGTPTVRPGAELGDARGADPARCASRATASTSPSTSPSGRASPTARRWPSWPRETLRADASVRRHAAARPPGRRGAHRPLHELRRDGGAGGLLEGWRPCHVAPRVRLLAGFSRRLPARRRHRRRRQPERHGAARDQSVSAAGRRARRVRAAPCARASRLEADAGWSWGWVRVTASPAGRRRVDTAIVNAPRSAAARRAQLSAEAGRARRSASAISGSTSGERRPGDQISGNSAGLIADLGYKMTF